MELQITTLDQAGVMLIGAVVAAIVGLTTSPIVLNLTALTKRIPFMVNVKAEFISYFWAGLITLGFWIAQHFGMDVQYLSGIDALTIGIGAAVSIVAALFGSQALYAAAIKRNMAVVGYKRS